VILLKARDSRLSRNSLESRCARRI